MDWAELNNKMKIKYCDRIFGEVPDDIVVRLYRELTIFGSSRIMDVLEVLADLQKFIEEKKGYMTVNGPINGLLIADLMGSIRFSPIATSYSCPICDKHRVFIGKRDVGVSMCPQCRIRMVRINHQTSLPWRKGITSSIDCYQLSQFMHVDIDIPCGLEDETKKIVISKLSKKYPVITELDSEGGTIKIVAIENNGRKPGLINIPDDDDYNDPESIRKKLALMFCSESSDYPTVTIRHNKTNTLISSADFDLVDPIELYSQRNITLAAEDLATRLPQSLQKDARNIKTLDELMRVYVVAEQLSLPPSRRKSGLTIKSLNQALKSSDLVRVWTDIPITVEAQESWLRHTDKGQMVDFITENSKCCGIDYVANYVDQVHRLLMLQLVEQADATKIN